MAEDSSTLAAVMFPLKEREASRADERVALVCITIAFPEALVEKDGEALGLVQLGVDAESGAAVVLWFSGREDSNASC